MPTKAFNDRWLKSVKPSDATNEYTDAGCPCLTVRVGKRSKSFNVMVGPKGARRRIRIGVYPAMSISAARRQAESLAQDPQAQAGGKPVEYETRDVGTVEDLFEMVLAAMREEGKAEETIDDYEHYLLTGRANAASEFGRAMAAKDVTPRMATAWLAKFRARGSSSRLPRAILSAAFSRGVKADNNPDTFATTSVQFGIPFNPVSNVGGQTQSNSLDRYLSLDELKTFWRDLKPPAFTAETGLLARMLIAMGGVRVTEVCRSRNDMWIDKGDWKTLDAGILKLPKTKNGRKHDLPITRSGDAILPQARTFLEPGNDYLFPSSRKPGQPRTFRSLTQAVRRYCERAGFKPFTPRDIRRTMKTHLLEADTARTDVDIWHNHGRNADVARKNYDRANYEQAKARVRDAIDRIVDQLERR